MALATVAGGATLVAPAADSFWPWNVVVVGGLVAAGLLVELVLRVAPALAALRGPWSWCAPEGDGPDRWPPLRAQDWPPARGRDAAEAAQAADEARRGRR